MNDTRNWQTTGGPDTGPWYTPPTEPDFTYQLVTTVGGGRFGAGPYILPNGLPICCGAQGDWVAQAQGTTAIVQISEWPVINDPPPPSNTGLCALGGIMSDLRYTSWQAGPTTNCLDDVPMSWVFNAVSPTAGNVARFGGTAPGATISGDYMDYMGNAQVVVQDSDLPSLTVTSEPTAGWHRRIDGSTLASSAHDNGIGMGTMAIKTDYCSGSSPIKCPQDSALSTTINGMPEGIDTVTFAVTDNTGNASNTTRTVKIDDSAPTAVYGGDVPASAIFTPGKHTLTVNATDGVQGGTAAQQRSGVQTIAITDLDQIGHDHTVTQGNPATCSGYGCPAAGSMGSCPAGTDSCAMNTTFTLDTTDGTWSGGTHRIQVTTTDKIGNSTRQTYTASNPGLTLPGARCDATSTKVADGYAVGTYVGILAQQSGSKTRVCVQVANGTSINKNAIVEIDTGSVSAGLPSVDPANDSDACTRTLPNAAPGQHPAFDVTVAGSQRIMLDTYSGNGQAWVCVQVGSVKQRVIVPVPSLTTPPSVSVMQDAPPPPPPPLTPWPPGPSATCTASGGMMLADSTYGPLALWLAYNQPNSSTMDLCVRTQGPTSVGGLLHVTTNPSDGVQLVLQPGTSMTACNQPLIDMDAPTRLHVWVKATNPATVCVDNGTVRTYTVGTTGSGAPTYVSWTPDTGTPIPPASI
jgi:hypothetical protein